MAAGVVAGCGAGLARLRIDTGVSSLLPASDATVRDWEAAQRSFGGDPVVVLVEAKEPGQLLGPAALPQLLSMEGRLAALSDVAVVYGPGTVANQIAGQVQGLLLDLAAQRDALAAGGGAGSTDEKARGALADFEARYGSLIVAGLPVGLPTLRNPGFAPRIFLDEAGAARGEFRWIVPDARHVAVYVRPREGLDQGATAALVAAVRTTVRTAGLPAETGATVTGAPVVAAALGAAVRHELPRLGGVALVGVAAAFLLVHRPAPGARRDRRPPQSVQTFRRIPPVFAHRRLRLLPLALSLAATAATLGLFGLAGAGVSLGLAAFLPIMVGVGSDFPIQATHPAARRTILATAAASAAGFAALALSPLPFVRSLGLALALGVALSCALGLAASRPVSAPVPVEPAGRSGPPAGRPFRHPTVSAQNFRYLGLSAPRHGLVPPDRRLVALGAAVAAVGLGLLPTLPLETRPDRLAAGLPAIGDARRAERVLGASGEMAVWARGGDVLTPATLAWFRTAEAGVVSAFGDRLRPVVSPGRLLRFLGPSPTDGQIDAALRVLPGYLSKATIRSDQREAVMSFGLRLGDLSRQAALVEGVRRTLPPPPAGVTVGVTGLPVVAARARDLLAGSRVPANLLGLAVVAAVLLATLERRRHAAAAALAAALAFGWGLLALRLTGLSLSPLTVTLGTLTAAVGAEFTVFARERVAAGTAQPWRGVVAAAATSVAGFAALAVSRLQVLREFGLTLAGSVLLSLLAARLLTPSAPSHPTEEQVPFA